MKQKRNFFKFQLPMLKVTFCIKTIVVVWRFLLNYLSGSYVHSEYVGTNYSNDSVRTEFNLKMGFPLTHLILIQNNIATLYFKLWELAKFHIFHWIVSKNILFTK